MCAKRKIPESSLTNATQTTPLRLIMTSAMMEQTETPSVDLDAPMDADQAAAYLKLDKETLHRMRRKNEGPAVSLIGTDGRSARYTLRNLMAFMESRKAKIKKPRK